MNMSNSFHAAFGSHSAYWGSSPMISIMIAPAKMLPKSRRDSDTGLTSSSRTLSGKSAGTGLK